jgi:predicted Zn-dependent protease with MMP-like domain
MFLANLWDWEEEDEQDFHNERGTTFLHELGHYLGWDEDEVNAPVWSERHGLAVK